MHIFRPCQTDLQSLKKISIKFMRSCTHQELANMHLWSSNWKKKTPLWWTIQSLAKTVGHHSASLVMTNSYPRNGIFNLHLTAVKDSYLSVIAVLLHHRLIYTTQNSIRITFSTCCQHYPGRYQTPQQRCTSGLSDLLKHDRNRGDATFGVWLDIFSNFCYSQIWRLSTHQV